MMALLPNLIFTHHYSNFDPWAFISFKIIVVHYPLPFLSGTFTLHNSNLTGTMPDSICANRIWLGGQLRHLWADCGEGEGFPKVVCSCCTRCFAGPTGAPTTSPAPSISSMPVDGCLMDTATRRESLFKALSTVIEPEVLEDERSSLTMALRWIELNDERHVCPNEAGLLQRYIMAVFYFSTGGNSWQNCSAVPESGSLCNNEEEERFLSYSHECKWMGVTCGDEMKVIGLQFGKILFFLQIILG